MRLCGYSKRRQSCSVHTQVHLICLGGSLTQRVTFANLQFAYKPISMVITPISRISPLVPQVGGKEIILLTPICVGWLNKCSSRDWMQSSMWSIIPLPKVNALIISYWVIQKWTYIFPLLWAFCIATLFWFDRTGQMTWRGEVWDDNFIPNWKWCCLPYRHRRSEMFKSYT